MMPLDGILVREATLFLLSIARISGLLIGAPLPWKFLPTTGRAAFAILLAILSQSMHPRGLSLELSLLHLALALGSEFFLGFALGFVVRLAVGVAEIAAESVAPVMGLGAAQIFDPSVGSQSSILSKIMRHVCLFVALSVGVHHLLLGGLLGSFRAVPVGQLLLPARLTPSLLQLSAEMLIAGTQLALPIVAILFVTQVALAFVARSAPAMQIFSVGFAVTLGVGGLLWILFAKDLVLELSQLRYFVEEGLLRLLSASKGT
ncbi:MAG: flagellar biosynthetic protein FliR [Polyangiaceae bacterium]|nr:flagellar biosynthetic protein FliR [Polyangiaceae bacterium]